MHSRGPVYTCQAVANVWTGLFHALPLLFSNLKLVFMFPFQTTSLKFHVKIFHWKIEDAHLNLATLLRMVHIILRWEKHTHRRQIYLPFLGVCFLHSDPSSSETVSRPLHPCMSERCRQIYTVAVKYISEVPRVVKPGIDEVYDIYIQELQILNGSLFSTMTRSFFMEPIWSIEA